MAVSTSSYFSNSIIGAPQLGADIDIYETTSSPKYAIGFGFTRADGNKYRYAHFGALVAAGAVVATDVSESAQANLLQAGALVANLTKVDGETLNPNAVGSKYAQLVVTATADQFAGAYLNIHSGTGFGFIYRIRGNEATSARVTGNAHFELYDPIAVALDSNSEIAIVGSPYANLEGATTTDAVPAGVAVTNVTASNYGWICTHGVTSVLQDVTIGTIGKPVKLSSNTTAAVSCVADATSSTTQMTFPLLGHVLQAGTSAGYSVIFLQLE